MKPSSRIDLPPATGRALRLRRRSAGLLALAFLAAAAATAFSQEEAANPEIVWTGGGGDNRFIEPAPERC